MGVVIRTQAQQTSLHARRITVGAAAAAVAVAVAAAAAAAAVVASALEKDKLKGNPLLRPYKGPSDRSAAL